MLSSQKQSASVPTDFYSISPNEENLNKLSLRALFSTENIYIISENTRNVLIETLDTQEGIPEVSIGITERRIVTVSSSAKGVAKAYSLIVGCLVSSSPSYSRPSLSPPRPSIQLLIPHSLMGSIVGRNGLKIKTIQEASGARIDIMKDLLAGSTERIAEVHGTPDAIRAAIEEIGRCLLSDWKRGQDTVFYSPSASTESPAIPAPAQQREQTAEQVDAGKEQKKRNQRTEPPAPPSLPSSSPPEVETQSILITSDVVGYVIGRSGTKINDIRQQSGAKINIGGATPTGDRKFTLVGTPAANETALRMISQVMEERKRRKKKESSK